MQNLLFKPLPSYWRQILRQNFTRLERLVDFLELTDEQRFQLSNQPSFPLNLPLRLAKKIGKKTLNDPILKQFIPTMKESQVHPDFVLDPVADACHRREAKLLHKYQGRALLVCTSACAMHCRYCFRQNFDYDVEHKFFINELRTIADDSSIQEIILSGGDPLSLSDEILANLLGEISKISHVKRIRIHSRFPIGIPERIDESFLEVIQQINKQIYFVIHCNHPSEMDSDIFARLKELQKLGCIMLNQSVLLKDINDDVIVLKELCEMLVDHGIFPYYLHQLDRVQGSAHFEVEEEKGLYLIEEITKLLPGYAVPKYVREVAGEPSKKRIV